MMKFLRQSLKLATLLMPFSSAVFWYLAIINIISNCATVVYSHGWFAILCMVTLGFITAYVETALYFLLRWKPVQIVYLIAVAVIYNVLIITEYFNVLNFQTTFKVDIIEILAETNTIEIQNFADTYLQPGTIALWTAVILLFNALTVWLSILLKKKCPVRIPMLLSLGGIAITAIFLFSSVFFHNGMGITDHSSLSRFGYAFYMWQQKMQSIEEVRLICKDAKAEKVIPENPDVILILGESASVYHSQLYGYEKPTTPLMQKRKDDGELLVFSDVISPGDATSKTMYAIYPLKDVDNSPLFPACFKAAGYSVVMYNNQYFVNNGMNFLCDPELSDILFDYRNTGRYRYDMDMVNTIKPQSIPTLYIIHLFGQHYLYKERYPEEFRTFTADDYDKERWSNGQRDVIAHYDNATIYNDYVLNSIIEKFKDKDCCIIYISDHGEEVYDIRDFVGHGSAPHSPDISYQVRVPMYVWFSPTFSRPDVVNRLKELTDKPLITSFIPHTLLDLAGIRTEHFDATRSIVNSQYDGNRHRITVDDIDFDK